MNEAVEQAIQPDGGLFNLGWYLAWTPGNETATLDGQFTAEQLRDIADHMDKTQPSFHSWKTNDERHDTK